MDKRMVLIVVIAMAAIMGMAIFSNINGNVIATGSSIKQQEVSSEYYQMDVFEDQLNKEENINDTQNISRS